MFRRILNIAIFSCVFLTLLVSKPTAFDDFFIDFHQYWSEFGVPVCTESDAQRSPVIIHDGADGAFIAWKDSRDQLPERYSLYVQKISPDGQPLWTPGGVLICDYDEIGASIDYTDKAMTPDGEGGVIITWSDERNGSNYVYAQRIDKEGLVLWDTNGVMMTRLMGLDVAEPVIVTDGCGGAIIVMRELLVNILYANRIDGDGDLIWGFGAVTVSNDINNYQCSFDAITDGLGGALIVWADTDDDIQLAKILGEDGSVSWQSEVCGQEDEQWLPRLIPDLWGGAIIAWYDSRDHIEGEPYCVSIYAQCFDHAGNILNYNPDTHEPDNTQWHLNPNGVPIATCIQCPATYSDPPQITVAAWGHSYFVWHDESSGDYDIFAMAVTHRGCKYTSWTPQEGVTICADAGNQYYPSIASNQYHPSSADFSERGMIICWVDERDLMKSIYIAQVKHLNRESNEDPLYSAPLISDPIDVCAFYENQQNPVITEGGIVAWEDERFYGTTSVDLYTQRFQDYIEYPLYIDAEQASFSEPYGSPLDTCCGDYGDDNSCLFHLEDNAVLYEGNIQGAVSTLHYGISNDYSRDGQKSLYFRTDARSPLIDQYGEIVRDTNGYPVYGDCSTQRVELALLKVIPFHQTRYTGFSILIPEDCYGPDPFTTEFGHRSRLLMQWKQYKTGGPPLGIFLRNIEVGQDPETGDPMCELTIAVALLNVDYHAWHVDHNLRGLEIYTSAIEKGIWNDFVVGHTFDPNGCGWVEVWKDGQSVAEYSGKIAYPPVLDEYPVPDENIDRSFQYVQLRFGNYGGSHQHAVEVYFDEVRHGFSYDEVVPPTDNPQPKPPRPHQPSSPSPTRRENRLSPTYPNPFNPSTTIEFSIANRSHVTLELYNVAGQLVRTLVDEVKNEGIHRIAWDGKDNKGNLVASGIYFYQIRTPGFTDTKKMVLLR